MQVSVDSTTVRYFKNGKETVLRHRTEEQAQLAVEAINECERKPNMTLSELVELWDRCHAMPYLAERSRASYLSTFRAHILPYLGKVRVKRLSVDGIMGYIEDRAAETGYYRPLTPWVQRLQAVLTKARDWGLVAVNQVMRIDGLFLGGKTEFTPRDSDVPVTPNASDSGEDSPETKDAA